MAKTFPEERGCVWKASRSTLGGCETANNFLTVVASGRAATSAAQTAALRLCDLLRPSKSGSQCEPFCGGV